MKEQFIMEIGCLLKLLFGCAFYIKVKMYTRINVKNISYLLNN